MLKTLNNCDFFSYATKQLLLPHPSIVTKSMNLQFAARLCSNDANRKVLGYFSNEPYSIEPKTMEIL